MEKGRSGDVGTFRLLQICSCSQLHRYPSCILERPLRHWAEWKYEKLLDKHLAQYTITIKRAPVGANNRLVEKETQSEHQITRSNSDAQWALSRQSALSASNASHLHLHVRFNKCKRRGRRFFFKWALKSFLSPFFFPRGLLKSKLFFCTFLCIGDSGINEH